MHYVLVTYRCVADYSRPYRLKTTSVISVTLDQELRSAVSGRLWLRVSHELVPRWLGVAASFTALAGLEGLLPRGYTRSMDG